MNGTKAGKKKRGKAWITVATILVVALLALIHFLFPFAALPLDAYRVSAREAGQLRLHFLSVGQGDCTVVELPDGKILLIDGGTEESSSTGAVRRVFSSLGITKIDYLVVTYESGDRIGGLESLLPKIEVGKVFLPCRATLASGERYRSFVSAVLQRAAGVGYAVRGDRIEGEGYRALFLSPRSYDVEREERSPALSAVLRLEYAGVGVLFGGESTAAVQERLMAEYRLDPAAFGAEIDLENTPVVHLSSHGASGSSSAEWLEFLGWRTAILSCGAGVADCPSGETTANLRISNPSGETYRTDECGNIMLTVSGNGRYTVSFENEK